MGLAFVFCAALPVGSNAAKEEVESNATMITCVEACFKPITDCIKDCKGTSPKERAICYSACAQKIASINKCYGTCEANNIQN